MIRLLHIELKKIAAYRMFWAMASIYLLSVIFLFYGFPSLIDYFSLRSNAPEIRLLKNFLYNFPDIWQNLTWIASLRFFIKVFLGFTVIVLITNEFSFITIRHNIINGMSRADFLKGKIYLVVFFGIIATFIVLISGLILGYIFSSTISFHSVTSRMLFLVAYFVEILTYMLFSVMLGILVKRTGIAISLLFAYPIIELIIQQKVPEKVEPFLPINAINHILQTPNTSLIQFQSPDMPIKLQTALATQDFIVCLAYAALFVVVSFFVLKNRDL